jgi:ABC-2 type transport system permease protein
MGAFLSLADWTFEAPRGFARSDRLGPMVRTLRKWRALYGVYAQDWLAYKANGIIWIFIDMVTAITMPLVWASAARAGMIEGYDAAGFTAYYLAMLVLSSFITSHMMWELGLEIREGIFTAQLIRPMSLFQMIFIRNLAWRSIRAMMSLPFLAILALAYAPMLQGARLHLGWEFWVAVVFGHAVSVTVVVAIGMIALFVQEATTIFEMYYVPQLFLSGYLFPVAMLPEWARVLAKFLPFYYTTGVPVDLLVGRIPPSEALPLLGGQVAWIVLSFLAGKALWRAGLKRYTGVGN